MEDINSDGLSAKFQLRDGGTTRDTTTRQSPGRDMPQKRPRIETHVMQHSLLIDIEKISSAISKADAVLILAGKCGNRENHMCENVVKRVLL